jgi:CheY-like chemotaxis protein
MSLSSSSSSSSSPSSVTVLVVDDQPDLRLLVRTLITAANNGLHCNDEAASGEEAVAVFGADAGGESAAGPHDTSGLPTVVVLDQMMPGMTGIETARRILARHPEQRIILFSAYLDEALQRQARSVGIKACIDKRDFEQVVPTVRMVAAA